MRCAPEATKVRGCTSQVWLASEVDAGSGGDGPVLHFQGDSDAHIVRGLVAIIFALYNGKTAKEILAIEPETVFSSLGLKDHLSPQRSSGLASMVERIRADARAALAGLGALLNRRSSLARVFGVDAGAVAICAPMADARGAGLRVWARARTRSGGPGRRAPCPARSCRSAAAIAAFRSASSSPFRKQQTSSRMPDSSGPTASSARRTRSPAAITRSAISTPAPGAPRRPVPPPPPRSNSA